MPEAKKWRSGSRERQGLSWEHPEAGSPLDSRGADSTGQHNENSYREVTFVAQGAHSTRFHGDLQPAQNDGALEGIEAVSCQVLPDSEANPSARPGSEQSSLCFQGTSTSGKLKVLLCDQALWLQFSRQQNEMILTKQGRAMFPSLAYQVQGMDPSALYHIFVEVEPIDKYHWRYEQGQWLPYEEDKEEEEDTLPGNHFYQHPDSPRTGAHWMHREISFKNLKLTNKKTAGKNGSQAPILLKSCHKYQPRLHIEEVRDGKQHMPVSSSLSHTFTFPGTEFIAVTDYQNSEITLLKIQNNPFASAYREGGSRPGKSFKKVPAAGKRRVSKSSRPALLVSNYSKANCSMRPGSEQSSLCFQGISTSGKLKVLLCNHTLWLQFSRQQNEMMLTKQGRAMFPTLAYQIQGMDPSALYHIFVEVEPIDKYHWRYEQGQWLPYEGDKKEEEDTLPGNHFYQHPDSPRTGAHWMHREISFKNLKLTNKKTAGKNGSQAPILLKSHHKYQPRLHIEEVRDGKQHMPVSSSLSHTFTFPETEFIAVTAYQNSEIARLKSQNNPFSPAYRGGGSLLPPSGEGSGSTSSPPTLVVSNYAIQVQEGPGQDEDCDLCHSSQPPLGHPHDSRDTSSITSMALPLSMEVQNPDLVLCSSPKAVSCHPSLDTPTTQGKWTPSLSTCTSNGNSVECFLSEIPKLQPSSPETWEVERPQEQVCSSRSRSPSDFSDQCPKTYKKRCLSAVDSAKDSLASAPNTWGQVYQCLLGGESSGNTSQEAVCEGSCYPMGLQEETSQTKEKVIPTPWYSFQKTKAPLHHPFDSTDSGSQILSIDLHARNPSLLQYIGFSESKKPENGLSYGQGNSLHQPKPWSLLDTKDAESTYTCSGEYSDGRVPKVSRMVRPPASPRSLQPVQNDRALEGIQAVSCQILPDSEANPSARPGSEQSSLCFQGTSTSGKLKVLLCDQALWLQFSRQQNEMILTKQGRAMFPSLAYQVQGMDPSALYHIFVEVEPIDKYHWRYEQGQWLPYEEDKEEEEDTLPGNHFYQHPDSPRTGAHWMHREISFKNLKLTNKKTAGKNGSQAPILLKSCHKYQPRLHIEEVRDGKQHMPVSSSLSHTFTFPGTEFIAVTDYQNSEITLLKIQNNPFASAYREGGSRPGKSFKKVPAAGKRRVSKSSRPALLVSNYSKANCSMRPGSEQSSLCFQGISTSGKLKVLLCNHTLWLQFSRQQNEMMLTKQGRAMFPTLAYQIQGMDPSALYHIFVEVEPIDKYHWRYEQGQWLPYEGDKKEEEDTLPGNHFYQHRDSPRTGAHWMHREISFKNLKLTNKKTAGKNGSQAPILLKSHHKYQPRLHIEEVRDGKQHMPVSSSLSHTFTFPETEFIAVTAYQNSEIARLKSQNNPFSPAYRGGGSLLPPSGEGSGSTSSPPTLVVSNYAIQVQEGPGQDKDCDLFHGSQPPLGHPYDSRDTSSITSMALPLSMEVQNPDLVLCSSPKAVSCHPSLDTPTTQGKWTPSLSICTSKGNSVECFLSELPKPQPSSPETWEEERPQEQVCSSRSRSPSDFSDQCPKTYKKRCLSAVDSAKDSS
ncbi:uncharacterized protein LOC130457049 [Monodelphis domestica]|uniref:uncharacterized protein LOC130457049 n=1 Tax=Monodelphis domestica TaxID=13616 RepID=UPI0024E1CBA1|nr:uncharacterized protein LOC130457049 [Monodelphis domestica]